MNLIESVAVVVPTCLRALACSVFCNIGLSWVISATGRGWPGRPHCKINPGIDEIAAHGHKGLCGFVLRGSEWAIHKTGSGSAFIDI